MMKGTVNWSQELKRQWRRHSLWRLSLSIALMLWFTVALALLAVYQFSIQPLVQSKHQLIAQHIEQLQTVQELNSGGKIERWLSDTLYENDSIITVIKTPSGDVLGSLSHIPSALPTCPSLAPFPIFRIEKSSVSILEGCTFMVSDYQVLVATNYEYIRQIQENFINAALVIMILCFFIALIPGWIVRRKISQQLKAIDLVVHDIEQGYFNQRLPSNPALSENERDEWERIGQFINYMLDEVEASIHQIQGVTDAIAHDLRTPLTRIKNRLSLLESEQDIPQVQQHIMQLHSEFDAILMTFNAMLELSKLEAQQDRSAFSHVNLVDISTDVIELIEPMLEDKQQQITLDAQPCVIQGERSLLFRMVYNLVDNAHKYSPAGAQVVVRIRDDRIVVEDSGPGIAPELHCKVYQRLFRLDASRHTPGHGLGLPLVAVVAKLHGGEIGMAYSNLEKKSGLKTTIVFPPH
ncbi:two-component sensor histidine kinase [Vibrio sp. 10N.286.49.B3]|uniref:sensor histidine kinase n=1 Tax=Vibrio sp. 10N.286.49.B3 TaxID=1880855 RepID=UPI000C83778A|nr:HAMP domain-containing sensor histidine kinase [Vibrio sp. 10N.286.49.B3]PMH46227.1 two-component sensor histidine kinase [Vibrio sp. 10N.286.49.B3]